MSARYEFIDAEKATRTPEGSPKYPLVKMCQWLEVSTADSTGRRNTFTRRSANGTTTTLGYRADGTAGDAFAGSTASGATRASAAVLGSDRPRNDK